MDTEKTELPNTFFTSVSVSKILAPDNTGKV